MPKRLDIPDGTRYGRLVIIKEVEPKKLTREYRRMFLCRCDCGEEIVTSLNSLRTGGATSCGCKRKEHCSIANINRRTRPNNEDAKRIYTIWCNMKSRCFRKTASSYNIYGARGISVCDDWRNEFLAFYEWAIANGYKPGLTIDRIDCNGNYEPSNCRWATMTEQANNKRKNVLITHNGETHTIAEWSRLTGINRTTIRIRLINGWDDEMLFSKPICGVWRKKGSFYGKKQ